jgi:hypothetical protein
MQFIVPTPLETLHFPSRKIQSMFKLGRILFNFRGFLQVLSYI